MQPKVNDTESSKLEGEWKVLSGQDHFAKVETEKIVFESGSILCFDKDSSLIIQSGFFVEEVHGVDVLHFNLDDLGIIYGLNFRGDTMVLKDALPLQLGDTTVFQKQTRKVLLVR